MSSRLQQFSTTEVYFKNYYDILEIPEHASQSEIKTAYYKLSKTHHPDKNYGCPTSTQKFKYITEAYEKLTSEKMSNIHTKNSSHNKLQRSKSSCTSNRRSPVTFSRLSGPRKSTYNFDTWLYNHYGHSIETRNAAKVRYETKIWYTKEAQNQTEKEFVIFCFLLLSFCFYMCDGQFMFNQDSKLNVLYSQHKSDNEIQIYTTEVRK